MKCQGIFSGEIKKNNIISLLSALSAMRVVLVKYCMDWSNFVSGKNPLGICRLTMHI